MINFYRNEIAFGTGDVCIYMSGEKGCGRLIFRNQDPQEILSEMSKKKAKAADPSEEQLQIDGGDIILSFTNAQSVDAVIRSLLTIKSLAFNGAS